MLKVCHLTDKDSQVFVQAVTTPKDEAAIGLYTKLGIREDVLHFDIAV